MLTAKIFILATGLPKFLFFWKVLPPEQGCGVGLKYCPHNFIQTVVSTEGSSKGSSSLEEAPTAGMSRLRNVNKGA